MKLAVISQIRKDGRPVNGPSDNLLFQILEWIWVPIVFGGIKMWQRLNGQETRAALLEQANGHYEAQRKEDKARHAEDRKAIEHRFDRVETLIKNGHK